MTRIEGCRGERGWISSLALVLLVLSPLAALPGFGEDSARRVWFVGVALLLEVSWMFWSVGTPYRSARPHPILILGGLLTLAEGASTVTSGNPWEGLPVLLMTVAGIAVCSVVSGQVHNRTRVMRAVFGASAVTSILLTLFGLLQRLGWDPLWGAEEAVSFLGNTTRAGAVAAMLAPVCASGLLIGEGAQTWKILFGAGAAASVTLVFLSGSLGAMLALAAATGVFCIGLVRAGVVRARWAGLLIVGLLVLAGIMQFGQVTSMAGGTYGTHRVRTSIWKGALSIVAEHPVLGCGPGNFRFEFPPHRDPAEFRYHMRSLDYREVEDAHSLYFAILSERGIVGALLWGWLLYAFFRIAVFPGRRYPDAEKAAGAAGAAGSLSAFLVAGLAMDVERFAASYGLFWLMLGMLVSLGHPAERLQRVHDHDLKRTGRAIPLLVFALIYAVALAASEARTVQAQGLPAAERVAVLGSAMLPDVRWQVQGLLGDAYAARGEWHGALKHLGEALKLHPTRVTLMNRRAEVYANLGEFGRAEEEYRRSESIAPEYPMTPYNLGVLYKIRGDGEGVRRCAEALIGMSRVHASEGRAEVAQQIADLVERLKQ